ncbi:MAG TPA: hypothetical protein VEY32_13495 [Flavisolibacter sp.]|nr:hypothetical protein [Flavisolibacter sp.]
MLDLQLQSYYCQSFHIEFYAPDPLRVKNRYKALQEKDPQAPFPFWAKVWPSAKALAQFLITCPEYIADKKVMEIAAGLGLPTLVAARWATSIECSDYLPEAVDVIQHSVAHNQLQNVKCVVRDWASITEGERADVLLLSDVNYAPGQFGGLYCLIERFLDAGTVVVLATPHRLMARPFMEHISPWVVRREEINIQEHQDHIAISILVLQKIKVLPVHSI